MNFDSLGSVKICVFCDINGHTFFLSKYRNIFFIRKSCGRRFAYLIKGLDRHTDTHGLQSDLIRIPFIKKVRNPENNVIVYFIVISRRQYIIIKFVELGFLFLNEKF